MAGSGGRCAGRNGTQERAMSRRIVAVDPNFGPRLRELREQSRLSLRRLGRLIHCSHGYLWDLEVGNKRPSVSVAALLDAALGADGRLRSEEHTSELQSH